MSDYSSKLPGLLGDPDLTPATDPRIDPRLVEVMTSTWGYGDLDELAVGGGPDSSGEELLEYFVAYEAMSAPMYAKVFGSLPPVPGVTQRTRVIEGVDGNEIPLFIHEPAERGAERERPLPGIVHIHGGGMGVFSADDPQYRRWKDELAARGMVVVGVEFRNSAGKLGTTSSRRV